MNQDAPPNVQTAPEKGPTKIPSGPSAAPAASTSEPDSYSAPGLISKSPSLGKLKKQLPKSDPEAARPRARRSKDVAKSRQGFFELDQVPPDKWLIEQWAKDWDALLGYVNRDGSYDAVAEFYFRGEGYPLDDAFKQAEAAAGDVPGPAAVRFVIKLPPFEEVSLEHGDGGGGGSGPKRYVHEGGESSIMHGPIRREYNYHASMQSVWRYRAELDLGYCRLDVHWPAAKSERVKKKRGRDKK